MGKFGKVPVEATTDDRLGAMEFRTLVAIAGLADGKTGKTTQRVKRSTIAKLSRLTPNKVSQVTAKLASLGWIKKTGDGGRSQGCIYQILTPKIAQKIYSELTQKDGDFDTPENLEGSPGGNLNSTENPTQSGNLNGVLGSPGGNLSDKNPTPLGNSEVPQEGRGTEQTNEQSKNKTPPIVPQIQENPSFEKNTALENKKNEQESDLEFKLESPHEKPAEKNDQNQGSEARLVLEHLNQVTGRNFRPVSATLAPIRARLADGHTVDDCRLVIEFKNQHWSGTPDEQYLRPSTLFRPSKFDGYLQAAISGVNPHANRDRSLAQIREQRREAILNG